MGDVNLYASENNTSEAMATIDSGTYYPLVAEDGKVADGSELCR